MLETVKQTEKDNNLSSERTESLSMTESEKKE